MGCNGHNHAPDCDCDFRGGHGRTSLTPLWPYPWFRNPSPDQPNGKCPVCRKPVFFVRPQNGGSVYFDSLGPPWPKHPCMVQASLQKKAPISVGWVAATAADMLILSARQGLPVDLGTSHLWILRGELSDTLSWLDPSGEPQFMRTEAADGSFWREIGLTLRGLRKSPEDAITRLVRERLIRKLEQAAIQQGNAGAANLLGHIYAGGVFPTPPHNKKPRDPYRKKPRPRTARDEYRWPAKALKWYAWAEGLRKVSPPSPPKP